MVPLWENAATGISVIRLGEQREVAALVNLFEGVAEEKGWEPGEALQLSRDRSVYFGLKVQGHLAGGLQVVAHPFCKKRRDGANLAGFAAGKTRIGTCLV